MAHCHSKIAPKAMRVVGSNRRWDTLNRGGGTCDSRVTNGTRGHPRESTNVIMKRRPERQKPRAPRP